jgi:hypothetical protein
MSTSSAHSAAHVFPEIIISGPDSIVAGLPFIIGFTPHDSVVVMWLRESCVRLTMRVDLPPDEGVHSAWLDSVMAHRADHDEAIVCVLSSPDMGVRDSAGALIARDLVVALRDRMLQAHCQVRECLLILGDRWWTYPFAEQAGGPADGAVVDRGIADEIAARFAFAGVARLPDRAAVLAICAADPARQSALLPLVQQARQARDSLIRASGESAREAWRDMSIALILDWLRSPEPSSARHAEILVALCDVRVRDTALWGIAQARDQDSPRAFDRAAEALRGAPPGVIAPVGSVTAVLAWLMGDGVRATAALDRVRQADPDYPLAELLRRSLAAGLSPASWLSMMRQLDRAACRGQVANPSG